MTDMLIGIVNISNQAYEVLMSYQPTNRFLVTPYLVNFASDSLIYPKNRIVQ